MDRIRLLHKAILKKNVGWPFSDSQPTAMVSAMVFNAIYNYISVISSRLVLLVEKTGEPEENHLPTTSH